jgi:hypothetical protein
MAAPSDQLQDALPLSRFSFYLSGRVSCVRELGEEVLEGRVPLRGVKPEARMP